MAPMQKPQLVAVDTNVLMRLASEHAATVDAWELIRRRVRPVQFLTPPTVLDELRNVARDDPDPSVRQAAYLALRDLRTRWQFLPVDFNAVQEAVAENAARHVLESRLMPCAERNDTCVITEAAVLDCILLVSRDSHLLEIDRERLALLLRQLDLSAPVIASPEALLRKFYR
jgi:rRNA-processing protein FCF1